MKMKQRLYHVWSKFASATGIDPRIKDRD